MNRPQDPRSDLEKAGDELDVAWQQLFHALKDSPPGRAFIRFADWLFTLGKGK